MLKWLVQKMPDPIKSGIGKSDNRHINIENLTDDPLATLDLRYADAESGLKRKLNPPSWMLLGSHSDEQTCKEVYSVNRYDIYNYLKIRYYINKSPSFF